MKKGQIIYKTIEDRSTKIYETKLTTNEIQQLIDKLIPSDDINDLDVYLEASRATDQPTNTLSLNYSKRKDITVYGHLGVNSEDRESVPDDFLEVYDSIKSYRNKAATEWQPKQIEIMFWDYDYAPNKRPWIENFPDLNSLQRLKLIAISIESILTRKTLTSLKNTASQWERKKQSR